MSFEKQVIKKIKSIPPGKVATYGQIAALAGTPKAALMVINSEGRISIINMSYPAELQAKLLQDEGVKVEMKGGSYYVDLAQYLWHI